MKMSKGMYIATISVIVFVSIMMVVLGMLLSTVVDKEESLIYNAKSIRDNYNQLNTYINENRKIRTELTNKLITFTNEDYPKEEEQYLDILDRYQTNVENVDKLYKETAIKCQKELKDETIKLLCKGYIQPYEELINVYITNLNNYNNKILKYNNINNSNYETIELLYHEYLDVDEDGIYSGFVLE